MKVFKILVIFSFLLSGCAGTTAQNPDQIAQATGTMANTLLVTKRTAIEVFTTISNKCQVKMLDTTTCAKAEQLYQKIQPSINAAEQSVIIAATTGDLTQANANQAAVNGLIADLMALKGEK